jgi:hypothetical protein
MRPYTILATLILEFASLAVGIDRPAAHPNQEALASLRAGEQKFCAECYCADDVCSQCMQAGSRWVKCNNPQTPTDWRYVQNQSPAHRVDLNYLNSCGGLKLHYYQDGCTGGIDSQLTVPCDRQFTTCTDLGTVPGVNCP